MWKSFYELNNKKIQFSLKACIAIFGCLSLVVTGIVTAIDKTQFVTVIAWSVLCTIGITLLICVVGIATEYYRFSTRRKFFERQLLADFFAFCNFSLISINTDNNWHLTQEAMLGTIDTFKITALPYSTYLRFDFHVTMTPIKGKRFDELNKQFKTYGGAFDFETIHLLVPYADLEAQRSIAHLKAFADLLITEGFKPAEELSTIVV